MKRLAVIGVCMLGLAGGAPAQDLRSQATAALRKAVDFYTEKASIEGGYHFNYAEDFSYGRSEHAEGMTQVTVQRAGTPLVGMAYLDAWEATGDRHYLEAARSTAYGLVRGQLCSGGWYLLIEYDPAKRGDYAYRADNNCGHAKFNTTDLDDNITQAALRLMMRVDRELEFRDEKIHEAALYALDRLMTAQYPNGAWPQRFEAPPDPNKFPVKRASYQDSWEWKWPGDDYRLRYTFNDNTIADVIDMFLEAARIYNEPKYLAAAERGGDFILLAQMPDPQPAWAQQYDIDMHPAWARQFEPPSISGGESQGILRMLMVLYAETGNRKYLDAVSKPLSYLERSILRAPANPSEAYGRASRGGGPVIARFHELKTNKPLYITKGTQIQVRGGGVIRPDNYELSYSDESVIAHYSVLNSAADIPGIRKEYERVKAAEASTLRRPGKLHGLSPWSDDDPRAQPTEAQVRRAIETMNGQGAWVREGSIGRADQVISLIAARPMVVRIGNQTLPLAENERIQVFDGAEPPRERIISSQTFAANVGILARYLAGKP